MSVLDITQDDNVTVRVGDKLKGRVAFVTGGTRGIGAAHLPQPREPGRRPGRRLRGQRRRGDALSRRLRLHVPHRRQHPQGQRGRSRRLPAHHRRGHRHPRAARHPRQQRRHHHRQDRAQDVRRRLVQGAQRQPVRRVLPVAGGAAPHGRARQRPHRERVERHRRDGQHRPGQLRGVQVGALRPDQDAGARGRAAPRRAPASSPIPTASASP